MTDKTVAVYRRKMDGSFDSICLNCLGTISMEEEATDAELDAIHACGPMFEGKQRRVSEYAG